ncbi:MULTISPECIES: hypothetical protein [Deinococcus]|uniref:Lincosamide nucleotidyltransferase-like C-terminal domain-containing protein n=1 Tax=Deinococcus rufus TaxID=2136097 RepID=A0ABV7ZA05_9DEIO|nr:hypothetical protein [Deinococcus sp. AB2017081]WQE95580.1 hypothetical protein U2P90_01505 [Deinococcus sp. AB2017081]
MRGHLLDTTAALDAHLRAELLADDRVTHAVAYGSVPQGTADAWSDVEYWAFLAPGTDAEAATWLRDRLPVLHTLVNEFGTTVALLPGLRRVELHLVPQHRLPEVENWTPEHVNPARMLVKDTDGQLAAHLAALSARTPDPPGEAQMTLDRTLNWLILGLNVLARGERLRALEVLWWIQGGVLRLARLRSGHTQHWGNATRRAEWEVDTVTVGRSAQLTCDLDGLEPAYMAAVQWTLELAEALNLSVPPELATDLRQAVHTHPA